MYKLCCALMAKRSITCLVGSSDNLNKILQSNKDFQQNVLVRKSDLNKGI